MTAAGSTLFTGDGKQDTVDCGDTVLAYIADVVDTACEKVIRKAPRSREDTGENNAQTPSEDRKRG